MIIQLKSIAKILGHLLTFIGGAMLVPLVYAALKGYNNDVMPFLLPAALSLALGLTLSITYRDAGKWITMKDSLLLTALVWLSASVIGAIPYLYAGILRHPFSALFESVSAFTTTGATVFARIGDLPETFLLWRAFSQWLGGIGVLILMQTLLPAAFENHSLLLRGESSGINTDNIFFTRKDMSRAVYALYIGMTVLQVLLLKLGGFGWFDAVCFSFGTSASGGMNTRTEGMLGLSTPFTEGVMVLFMILSGISFAIYFSLMKKDLDNVRKNTELKVFFGIGAASVILVTADLFINRTFGSLAEDFRYGGFQTVSFLTTTGYASADFNTWPSFSKMLLTLLSFIGGCSSSTGGALKIIRITILSKMVWRSFTTRIHPNAVVALKLNHKPLPSSAANNVISYTLTFFFLFLTGAFLLTFATTDFQTAFTASAAMLCNVGAGCGQMGMLGQYHMFHPVAQLLMSILMLAGRLEIYAILLPFTRGFWKEKI